VELSFSNSCLNSSLLSALDPVLYDDAIARAGSNGAQRRTRWGAQEAAGVNLQAAAAKRGMRRSGTTIAHPLACYILEGRDGLVVIAAIWTGSWPSRVAWLGCFGRGDGPTRRRWMI